MKIIHKIFCKLRYYYELFFIHDSNKYLKCEKNPQKVADMIYELLSRKQPCMICRFGGVELYCLVNYLGVKKGPLSFISFIRNKSDAWWWIPQRLFEMKNNAGFFSADDIELVNQYCQLMLQDIREIDILASWLDKEKYIADMLKHVQLIFLPYLEPYWANNPWSRILEGKKVLVVHPFADQIQEQYKSNRMKLFKNKDVLPEFELYTLKAIQSMGGDNNGFQTWFDALKWMESEMDKIDYEFCIIGCGAYGFHLAAHAKRMGKKALHIGGATQLLFGIKGNRWEDPMYGVKEWNLPYGFYTEMFNDYWIKPGDKGKPRNADSVEGACYW